MRLGAKPLTAPRNRIRPPVSRPIRAQADHTSVAEPTYLEYQLVNYFRQFELSDKVDQDKISADLKHGVLTLNLPKAEEAKPRKIAVAAS